MPHRLPLRPPAGSSTATYRPHAIVGDMDSLDEDTAEHYGSELTPLYFYLALYNACPLTVVLCSAQGVSIHRLDDQDSTDLDKCLSFVAARQREGMDRVCMLLHDTAVLSSYIILILAGRYGQSISRPDLRVFRGPF